MLMTSPESLNGGGEEGRIEKRNESHFRYLPCPLPSFPHADIPLSLFPCRQYLFQCADNSESVSVSIDNGHHLAYPIRDETGCAVVVVDFSLPPIPNLSPHLPREVVRILKVLTITHRSLSCLSSYHQPPQCRVIVE